LCIIAILLQVPFTMLAALDVFITKLLVVVYGVMIVMLISG